MRRLSVASPHGGAESPVCGTVSSADTAWPGHDGTGRYARRESACRPSSFPRAFAVGCGATLVRYPALRTARLATTYGMSVVYPQYGRWYAEDIRASTQPRGTQVTWYASSWAMPCGSRSPRKLTDVHGREG